MKGKGRTSICIDCEKSGGLCPWSAKLKPVVGWTATPVKRDTNGRYKKGLHITECPMFEKTQRKASVQPWTDEEIDELQEMIRQKARYKDIAVILGRSYRSVQFKVLELQRERRSKEMKVIKPYVEICDTIDGDAILKKIERCGRVCYKSEGKDL